MKKRLVIIVICFVILAMLTACSRPQNNEPSVSNGPNINEPAADYYPPMVEGLISAIADSDILEDGYVIVTADIKREFNQMGEDYRFFFMPDVDWYDFDSTGSALNYILFTWTGEFGTFPESAPKDEAEARLRNVFAAPNNEYPPLEHQTYNKYVMFDGESYTLWPESYNDNTMIYDLVELKMNWEENYTYYTATADEYQFDLNGYYEPGENEQYLFEQADALGLDYVSTLGKLLEIGEISSAVKSRTYIIKFRIEDNNTIPMIVSVDSF